MGFNWLLQIKPVRVEPALEIPQELKLQTGMSPKL